MAETELRGLCLLAKLNLGGPEVPHKSLDSRASAPYQWNFLREAPAVALRPRAQLSLVAEIAGGALGKDHAWDGLSTGAVFT